MVGLSTILFSSWYNVELTGELQQVRV